MLGGTGRVPHRLMQSFAALMAKAQELPVVPLPGLLLKAALSALEPYEDVLISTPTSIGEALLVTQGRAVALKAGSLAGAGFWPYRWDTFWLDECEAYEGGSMKLGMKWQIEFVPPGATRVECGLSRSSQERKESQFRSVRFRDRRLRDRVLGKIQEIRETLNLANSSEHAPKPTPQGFIAGTGEVVYYYGDAKRYAECQYQQIVAGVYGVSVPFLWGISTREIAIQGILQTKLHFGQVDFGRVVLTNQRLLFFGSRQLVSTPLAGIANLMTLKIGVRVDAENREPIILTTGDSELYRTISALL